MSQSGLSRAPALPARNRPRAYRRWIRYCHGLWIPAILLLLWQTLSGSGWVSARLLPSPSELLGTLAELVGSGALLAHAGISTLRLLTGFCIGSALGILAGSAAGLSQRVEALFGPTFRTLRTVPLLAWMPLALLWLGFGEATKITLIAIGAFFPVYLNVVAGIHDVDDKLLEVGGIFGLTGSLLITRVFLPAALPNLFSGLRSGLTFAWMLLIAVELTAATSGLGYLLTDGRETGRADLIIVAIVVLALLGKAGDRLLQRLKGRLLGWQDVVESRQS